MKKVVDGSNEGLMKEFFAQIIAGRERWLVPGKTFCESFLLFSCLDLICRCYLRPFLDKLFSVVALHLSLGRMAGTRSQKPI